MPTAVMVAAVACSHDRLQPRRSRMLSRPSQCPHSAKRTLACHIVLVLMRDDGDEPGRAHEETRDQPGHRGDQTPPRRLAARRTDFDSSDAGRTP